MELFGAFKSANPTRTVHLACLLGGSLWGFLPVAEPGWSGRSTAGWWGSREAAGEDRALETGGCFSNPSMPAKAGGAWRTRVCGGSRKGCWQDKGTVERNVRSAWRETLRATCQQIKFIRSAT